MRTARVSNRDGEGGITTTKAGGCLASACFTFFSDNELLSGLYVQKLKLKLRSHLHTRETPRHTSKDSTTSRVTFAFLSAASCVGRVTSPCSDAVVLPLNLRLIYLMRVSMKYLKFQSLVNFIEKKQITPLSLK
jgi:hypothetical protein